MSISQPSASSSVSAPSLFSMEIPLDVIDEIEDARDRERILWRNSCRAARDRRVAAEREAKALEEAQYPVVKASLGAVGDGRQWRERKEVSYKLILSSLVLIIFILVRKLN